MEKRIDEESMRWSLRKSSARWWESPTTTTRPRCVASTCKRMACASLVKIALTRTGSKTCEDLTRKYLSRSQPPFSSRIQKLSKSRRRKQSKAILFLKFVKKVTSSQRTTFLKSAIFTGRAKTRTRTRLFGYFSLMANWTHLSTMAADIELRRSQIKLHLTNFNMAP